MLKTIIRKLSNSIKNENIIPRRSILYIPGANLKALNKIPKLKTDGVILDMEDAVGPLHKDESRNNIFNLLKNNKYDNKEIIIRANGLNTKWGENDVKMISQTNCNGIAIPKIENKENIYELEEMLNKYKAPKSIVSFYFILEYMVFN